MKRRYSPQDVVACLKRKGYQTASTDGVAGREEINDLYKGIGILKRRQRNQRADHIANLWLHSKEHGAVENKKWIIEYFGAANIGHIMKLSQELSDYYRIKIERKLASQIPKKETPYAEPMFA